MGSRGHRDAGKAGRFFKAEESRRRAPALLLPLQLAATERGGGGVHEATFSALPLARSLGVRAEKRKREGERRAFVFNQTEVDALSSLFLPASKSFSAVSLSLSHVQVEEEQVGDEEQPGEEGERVEVHGLG